MHQYADGVMHKWKKACIRCRFHNFALISSAYLHICTFAHFYEIHTLSYSRRYYPCFNWSPEPQMGIHPALR